MKGGGFWEELIVIHYLIVITISFFATLAIKVNTHRKGT